MDVFPYEINPCGMVNEFLEDRSAFNDVLEIHAVFNVVGMRFDIPNPAWEPSILGVFFPWILNVLPMCINPRVHLLQVVF